MIFLIIVKLQPTYVISTEGVYFVHTFMYFLNLFSIMEANERD